MGPPADMEYAVEPLGVEMISPSACFWAADTAVSQKPCE
jgi:hypothetical protein